MDEPDLDDPDNLPEGIWCGHKGEHFGHHYFTTDGIEEWCSGYSPRFRSRPEPDEEFDWDDYEPDLDWY